MKALYIILVVVLLSGCAPSSEQMTATAVMAQAQTQTAAPTLTPTVTPTLTPPPTATSTPKPTITPQPTPAPVGETVKYNDLEITLLEVATHSHIVTGGYYSFYSEPGRIFVDIAVRVRNTGNVPVRMAMKNLYLVEESGDSWYANFSGLKTVEIEKRFNPMASLKIEETLSGETPVSFDKDTYLRLVWYTDANQDFLFGVGNAPPFTFSIK